MISPRKLLSRFFGRETGSSPKVFEEIYASGVWGRDESGSDKFFSGSGSRNPAVVLPYVEAVRKFLSELPAKPSLVDIGCGDFYVGRQLTDCTERYTGCDVVPALIEYNNQKYKAPNLDFVTLDITAEPPPRGEVGCIRQVFQHLSNTEISRALVQLRGAFRYLIITEHLPSDPSFVPNLDKPTGPNIRMDVNSGVDIGRDPFCINARSHRVLCEVPGTGAGGRIVTTLYEF